MIQRTEWAGHNSHEETSQDLRPKRPYSLAEKRSAASDNGVSMLLYNLFLRTLLNKLLTMIQLRNTAMNTSKKMIEEIIASCREDNRWDFKEKLDLSETDSVAEICKDFLAFANSDGGHIILGVNNSRTLVGVSKEYDPSELGHKIESILGVPISCSIAYHNVLQGGCEYRIGIIAIEGSFDYVLSKGVVNNKNNRPVILPGHIYIRKHTSSSPANSWDLRIRRIRALGRYIPPALVAAFLAIFPILNCRDSSSPPLVIEKLLLSDYPFYGGEGYSIFLPIKIFPSKQPIAILDYGESERANRLSIYVTQHSQICIRVIDNNGDTAVQKLVVDRDIPKEKLFILGVQIGNSKAGLLIKSYKNQYLLEQSQFPNFFIDFSNMSKNQMVGTLFGKKMWTMMEIGEIKSFSNPLDVPQIASLSEVLASSFERKHYQFVTLQYVYKSDDPKYSGLIQNIEVYKPNVIVNGKEEYSFGQILQVEESKKLNRK